MLFRSQDHWLWFLNLKKTTDLETGRNITYDSDELRNEIDSLDAVSGSDVVTPKDAYVAEIDGIYQIVDAVDGNSVDTDKVTSVISEALDSEVFSVDIYDNDCYLKASVYSDDETLIEQMNTMNATEGREINLCFGDGWETIDQATLLTLIDIGEDGSYTVNDDALAKWFDSKTSSHNTDGSMASISSGESEVSYDISPSDLQGFTLDRDATIAKLKKTILAGGSSNIYCTWDIPDSTVSSLNSSLGGTYILISIEKQHMWMFVGGSLFIETDVVTGRDNALNRTSTGMFSVWSKARNIHLVGTLGNDTWDSPVQYWMAITHKGVGIHDASWKSVYGGTIYKYAGSHGCINTPLSVVSQMYANAPTGTPVLVY